MMDDGVGKKTSVDAGDVGRVGREDVLHKSLGSLKSLNPNISLISLRLAHRQ